MSGRFAEKIVLVTGAASGIGRATAKRLAEEGASLLLADLNLEGLKELAAELPTKEVDVVRFDATDSDSCRSIVAHAIDRFGRIDVLCNIAGIAGAWRLEDMAEEKWDLMFSINMKSIFIITQAAMPHLVKTKGCIVNMSSVSSLQGQPYNSCYCAVKAAVSGFTRSIAAEFSREGVRAVAIAPGGVQTPIYDNYQFPADADQALVSRMMPLEGFELALPEEIAAAVAYVASDEARFMTGSSLVLDGGQTTL